MCSASRAWPLLASTAPCCGPSSQSAMDRCSRCSLLSRSWNRSPYPGSPRTISSRPIAFRSETDRGSYEASNTASTAPNCVRQHRTSLEFEWYQPATSSSVDIIELVALIAPGYSASNNCAVSEFLSRVFLDRPVDRVVKFDDAIAMVFQSNGRDPKEVSN